MSAVKNEYLLEGLDCANCALKIENGIKKLDEVSNATVIFATGTLIVERNNNINAEEIATKISEVVKRLDPKVVVSKKDAVVSGTTNRNKHYIFGAGVFVYLLAMILHIPDWLSILLFTAAYLLVGGEVLLRAAKNILRGQVFDENFLMALATIGAFAVGEYPEGVAVMIFYQVGELFQDLAVNRSRNSIKALLDIRPDYANLIIDEGEQKVSPGDVVIGSMIVVKPGERIPLDGIVAEGSSALDTSALTGESLPREVTEGSEVLSGCVNKTGLLKIRVTKEYSQSTVAKILELVENAGARKASTEKFITKFARYYTPVVVAVALFLAFIPPLFINSASLSDWVYRALIFLVISCPCALVISIPLGFFGGIGGASSRGILVKGGNYLEALNNIDTVIFDKTGTLTKGVFSVTSITPAEGFTSEILLEYAAAAESYSTHPIAQSIIAAYGKEIDKSSIESYEEIPGLGVSVKKSGRMVLAGNAKLTAGESLNIKETDNPGSVVYLSIDGKYAGNIAISDELKQDSADTIKGLKELGIRMIVMLTGDSKAAGMAAGKALALDEVYSELLPHQKVEMLERFDDRKAAGKKLVFVGDGINDAPVLARADIGVAMGGLGSDAAIEAADIVLMTDEPSKLITAIKIARKTKSIIWQNIFLALGIKAAVLLMGAAGLATMWEAVFADVGVAVIAILNAMRAKNI